MLLKIYEFIKKLQAEIGDGAEVRLSANDNALEIRVDWWDKDFHARRQLSEIELAYIADDNNPTDYFIAWCRNEYIRKVKEG